MGKAQRGLECKAPQIRVAQRGLKWKAGEMRQAQRRLEWKTGEMRQAQRGSPFPPTRRGKSQTAIASGEVAAFLS